jgi:N-acetylmuramoyl-L-alanine amidase
MRDIKYIAIHCTATSIDTKPKSILNYWKNALGWSMPGYHYLIDYNGVVHKLAEESQVCNGVKGFNSVSIHVSYIGGVDAQGHPKDTRSDGQKKAMREIVADLHARYPKAKIQGHKDFPNVLKACPSFNVAAWLKEVNL